METSCFDEQDIGQRAQVASNRQRCRTGANDHHIGRTGERHGRIKGVEKHLVLGEYDSHVQKFCLIDIILPD